MFAAIARFDVRFRWVIVVVWVAGAIAGSRLLPSLASVTQPSNTQFLASSAPSVQAGQLAAPFQGKANASDTAVIVASRASGPLAAADQAVIGRAEQAARRVPGVVLVRDQQRPGGQRFGGRPPTGAFGKWPARTPARVLHRVRRAAGHVLRPHPARARYRQAGRPVELVALHAHELTLI